MGWQFITSQILAGFDDERVLVIDADRFIYQRLPNICHHQHQQQQQQHQAAANERSGVMSCDG